MYLAGERQGFHGEDLDRFVRYMGEMDDVALAYFAETMKPKR